MKKKVTKKGKVKVNKKKESNNPYVLKSPKGFYYANENKLSHHLITQHNFKTIYSDKSDELYVFDGRIYRKDKAREIVKTECENLLKEYCKNKNIAETLDKVKRLTAFSREQFDNVSLDLIPFENGVYNLKTKNLSKHSPNNYFRFIIPINYDKSAKCPIFTNFLNDVLSEEDISTVQEYLGFCIYRRYFIKKGMIFVGEKDTGKTVLLNVFMKIIGDKNTSGINLQRIGSGDKFALASLYEKHLNCYDDLSFKDISDNGGFKIVTGGGYITAEYKFGDSFQFVNYAKQLFACNKIPPNKDNDDPAYFDRWLPIEFLNQIPESEQDKFLYQKLTSDKEMSGILNWALEGLDRLLKKEKFSFNKSHEEVKRIMEQSGNPLAKFCEEMLEEKPSNKISKEDMYELYFEWAKANKVSRLSKTILGRNLEKYAKYILDKTGKQIRFWENVGIKSIEDKKYNVDTLDTLKKIIRNLTVNSENINITRVSDIIKNNPSNPSKDSTLNISQSPNKPEVDPDDLIE